MKRKYGVVLRAVILATALSMMMSSPAHPIQVFIGDKQVPLGKAVPKLTSGHLLIPVRPIAKGLGADLEWSSRHKTLTIKTPTGTSSIRLGNPHAVIRGRWVYFPAPPFLYGGHVYAPILFFTEAFDMAVIWDPLLGIIRYQPIVPILPEPAKPPTIITGPSRPTEAAVTPKRPTATVEGEVQRVIPSTTDPRAVIKVNSRKYTYPIAPDALIVRGRSGRPGIEVPLGQVRPGDAAVLAADEQGVVRSLRASYTEVEGEIQSIAESTILLKTGEVVQVTEDTRIILPGNVAGTLADLQVKDVIAVRLNPKTRAASVITATKSESGLKEQETEPITLSATGPLREGDMLTITFKSYPGGTATYTLPSLAANSPMTETSPGVYVGEYTVKRGDVLPRSRVTVYYKSPDGETLRLVSRQRVTIATEAGHLPRIASPRQGDIVTSPTVVQGFAKPGSTVQVTIEYRQNLVGALPVEGVTALQEVRADSEGRFQTPPLPITVPWEGAGEELPFDDGYGVFSDVYKFKRYPITYTITATMLSPSGEELASYAVDVRKQEGKALEGGTIAP